MDDKEERININRVATPAFVINSSIFNENCSVFEKSFKKWWGENLIFGYSIKTNHHPFFINMAKDRGWYLETVSNKEYNIAMKDDYERVILNGPVKGKCLIDAIEKGFIVNVDNFSEIDELIDYINTNKRRDLIKVGIRVNFDLGNKCPGQTTSGELASRFGICEENGELEKAINILKKYNIEVVGLHMHTSTKTRSVEIFRNIAEEVCYIKNKYKIDLDYIDIGGGFFGGKNAVSTGKPTIDEYAELICKILKRTFNPLETTLILEPGAAIIATAVDYITRVDSVRQIREDTIVTVDGTCIHINPFMVEREYNYSIFGEKGILRSVQRICGSTCMEKDRFFSIRNIEEIEKGSILVFHNVGAYTMCFNSEFINEMPKVYLCDFMEVSV